MVAVSTGMHQGEVLGLRWADVDLDGPRRPSLQVRQVLQRLKGDWIVKVPKTPRSRRRIRLTRLAVAALRQHRATQAQARLALGPAWAARDLVFPNAAGEYLSLHVVRRRFARLLARIPELRQGAKAASGGKAGAKEGAKNDPDSEPRIRFHDLRHTCATLALARHVNPKIVSEMLGHASVGITLDTYSHVLPDMRQDLADVLDDVLALAPPEDPEHTALSDGQG